METKLNHLNTMCGNWVTYEGKPYQICSIQEIFPILDTTEFGIGVIDWNNISPIPLSELWLLRCDKYTKWPYFGNEHYGGYFSFGMGKKLMVRKWDSGFHLQIVTVDKKKNIYRKVLELNIKIETVSELQNLMHALKQPITFKPTE